MCVAMCCMSFDIDVAVYCSVMDTDAGCSVLQYVAVCCSMLQCVAMFCSVLALKKN